MTIVYHKVVSDKTEDYDIFETIANREIYVTSSSTRGDPPSSANVEYWTNSNGRKSTYVCASDRTNKNDRNQIVFTGHYDPTTGILTITTTSNGTSGYHFKNIQSGEEICVGVSSTGTLDCRPLYPGESKWVSDN